MGDMKLICPSSQVLLSIINKPIYLSVVAGTNGGRSVGAYGRQLPFPFVVTTCVIYFNAGS